jgi:hypothetical protein
MGAGFHSVDKHRGAVCDRCSRPFGDSVANLIRTLDVPLAQAPGSSVVALKANMHRMMKSFFVATALVAAASSAQAQSYNWNSPLNGGP